MRNCFDYSRCSLTSGFPVYLYDSEKYFPAWQIPAYLKTLIRQTTSYNPHFITNPRNACLFLVLIGESYHMNVSLLQTLPYWGGDGKFSLYINKHRFRCINSLDCRKESPHFESVEKDMGRWRKIVAVGENG